jgi:hypothetical protein
VNKPTLDFLDEGSDVHFAFAEDFFRRFLEGKQEHPLSLREPVAEKDEQVSVLVVEDILKSNRVGEGDHRIRSR